MGSNVLLLIIIHTIGLSTTLARFTGDPTKSGDYAVGVVCGDPGTLNQKCSNETVCAKNRYGVLRCLPIAGSSWGAWSEWSRCRAKTKHRERTCNKDKTCKGAKSQEKLCKDGMVLILRRGQFGNPANYFSRNWTEYVKGFGDIDKEYWIGLDRLAFLTNKKKWGLEVTVGDAIKWWRFNYTMMRVDPGPLYNLHTSGFKSEPGEHFVYADAMKYLNDMPFTTIDRRNNVHIPNECSYNYGKGGWWYNGCTEFQPTGLNLARQISASGLYHQFISGYHWRYSFPQVEMNLIPSQ